MLSNYLYISDEKVDLYFYQIEKNFLKSISSEVGINIGLIKASIRNPGSDNCKITPVQKLEIVKNYISLKYEVGTFELPGYWIREQLSVKHITVKENQDIFLLIAKLDDRYHLLAGSKKHIVGNRIPESVTVGYSYFPYIAEALEDELPEDSQDLREAHLAVFGVDSVIPGARKDEIANVIKALYDNSKSLEFTVEVLTPKPFIEAETTSGETCTISSPLCVSYI